MSLTQQRIGVSVDSLSDEQYRRLLTFRLALRRFQRWNESPVPVLGLTSAQHQLPLSAIRGHHNRRGPTIGGIADCLQLRQHSAVELSNEQRPLN